MRCGPHSLHGEDRIWVEKNCYVDLWIELLHARGFDPLACLSTVFALDFEGDQWTFFKPAPAELRLLYGIDVQELTVWRSLREHAAEHLGAGKRIAVEVDSFWLPDTAATDYRQAHGKTTIVLDAFDAAARRLGYFHNAGYFSLEGEDFDGLFADPFLPPFAESIRLDRSVLREPAELRALSLGCFESHLAWRAVSNPVRRFGTRLESDFPALQRAGLANYHRWAFAGIRQLGAGSELAGLYLRWLFPAAPPTVAAEAFERVAQGAKTLLLKVARAVNSGRPLDARRLIDEMAHDWDVGMEASRSSDS